MGVDRREQILGAAYEIVGSDGLEGLHARSVAAKVGINHAAVHYYYPKRIDLLVAVTGYAVARFSKDREKLLSFATTPTARIEAHLAQSEVYCKPNSRFLKNWTSYFVAAIVEEPIRRALTEHLQDWCGVVAADIAEGSKTGAVRKASPFVNSELLVASLLGLMLMSLTLGESFDAGERLDLIAGSLLS
jgi:AcrR family transcriptional regulator